MLIKATTFGDKSPMEIKVSPTKVSFDRISSRTGESPQCAACPLYIHCVASKGQFNYNPLQQIVCGECAICAHTIDTGGDGVGIILAYGTVNNVDIIDSADASHGPFRLSHRTSKLMRVCSNCWGSSQTDDTPLLFEAMHQRFENKMYAYSVLTKNSQLLLVFMTMTPAADLYSNQSLFFPTLTNFLCEAHLLCLAQEKPTKD